MADPTPPSNDETPKKNPLPWWGWLLIGLAIIGVISNAFDGDEDTQVAEETTEEVVAESAAPVEEVADEEVIGKPELLLTCDGLNEFTSAGILAQIMVEETSATLNNAADEGTPAALEAGVETVQQSGEAYIELANIFRDADDCGDPKFAELKNELGDSLEKLGQNFDSWTYDLVMADQTLLDEATVLMVDVSIQSTDIGSYIESATG